MNTENSKTNEFNKFIYQFTDQLNLKTPNNENIGLVNLSICYTWKGIESAQSIIINFKLQPHLGMTNLICLVDHILLQTFRITLNLSSKNTKFWLKILL